MEIKQWQINIEHYKNIDIGAKKQMKKSTSWKGDCWKIKRRERETERDRKWIWKK